MLLTTGLIGFTSYLAIHWAALLTQVRSLSNRRVVYVLPLLLAIVIRELFASFSIFGLSFVSVIAAIVVGYSLRTSRWMPE